MTRPGCHADRDGDCLWTECPQRVEYRVHCPLDNLCPQCHGEESGPRCLCGGEGFVPLEMDPLPPLASQPFAALDGDQNSDGKGIER